MSDHIVHGDLYARHVSESKEDLLRVNTIFKELSDTYIEYTFEYNTAVSAISSHITDIILTVPEGLVFGFIAEFNYQSNVVSSFKMQSLSSLPLYVVVDGARATLDYIPSNGAKVTILVYCDGISVNIYIHEAH